MDTKNRLREMRERFGLNMKEVAAKLGIPYTTYVNYEKGHNEPKHFILVRMADLYGTSTDFLLGREDEPHPPDIKPKNDIEITQDGVTVCVHLHEGVKLTKKDLAEIKRFVNFVAQTAEKNAT